MHVFVASWTAGCGPDAQRQRVVPPQQAPRRARHGELEAGAAVFILFACANFFLAGPSMALEVTHTSHSSWRRWRASGRASRAPRSTSSAGSMTPTQTTTGISHPVPAERPRLPRPERLRPGAQLVRAGQPTPPINLLFQVYHFMFDLRSCSSDSALLAGLLYFCASAGCSTCRAGCCGCSSSSSFFVESAIIAGWWTAEIGRQPWIVYNVMLTADGVSPKLSDRSTSSSRSGRSSPMYAHPAGAVPVPPQREDPDRARAARGGRDRARGVPCRTRSATSSRGATEHRRSGDEMMLADLWFVLFIVIIAGYLILDGFDMGVGILPPAARPERRRAPDVPQQHRPGLGRQRGLAGPRRWRPVRGLPARLRLAVLGLLRRVHARALS